MDNWSLTSKDLDIQSAFSLCNDSPTPLGYQGRLKNPLRLVVVELVAEEVLAVPLFDACIEWEWWRNR